MGKFTEFQLPLKSLPAGEHRYNYHLDKRFFDNMESADVRDADIDAALTVVHKSDVYDLTMHLTGTITVPCDRCLDDLGLPVDTTYHIMVKYGDAYRDDSDELLEIPESESTLNVAYMLYDTASLAIPMKHVHPMGKCNRQMSSVLRKHRAHSADDADAELENRLVDEMDSMDAVSEIPADPRWDALRGLGSGNTDTDGDSE
ncbi:MAG: DUF177 domain-containing protein [Bacteroidales bacterium]|nr:DUF177 domain-containing protein [Bacteroidales bacterium]